MPWGRAGKGKRVTSWLTPRHFPRIGAINLSLTAEKSAPARGWPHTQGTLVMTESPALRRLDHLIWALVAAVTAIVLAAPFVSGFYIDVPAFGPPILAALTLTAGAWFYRRVRPDPRLASGLENTAQVIAFAAVGAPLSYLAAAVNLPLQDHIFDAADRALGLDWSALLDWMDASPITYAALRPIYLSLTLQMTTAVLCLAFTGRLLWLRIYTLSFIFAALITIAISAMLPAAGAWPFHALTAFKASHITSRRR